MPFLEQFDAQLEAVSTYSATRLVTATALTIFLLGSQRQPVRIPAATGDQPSSINASSSTAQVTREVLFDVSELWRAIMDMHDGLLREQIELPSDERTLIHSRLWDLYD